MQATIRNVGVVAAPQGFVQQHLQERLDSGGEHIDRRKVDLTKLGDSLPQTENAELPLRSGVAGGDAAAVGPGCNRAGLPYRLSERTLG